MASRPKIISIANQKGGVGKTTTVANLAASLAENGNKILVIDCDYQANATSLLCGDTQIKKSEQSFTYAIKNDLSFDKVMVKTAFKNIDVVPSNRELDDLREQLVGQPNQFKLVDLLLDSPKIKDYDFVIIDTHPSLDCFFQSAVAASHYYIIPLFPEADSSRGLAHQMQAIDKIKRYLNPGLKFLGCVIVKYDRYNATHQKFEKLIREFGKENNFSVFKTNIPNSQSVAAAAAHGLPLFHYKNDSPASKAYKVLSKEVVKLVEGKSTIGTAKASKKKSISLDIEVAADL